MTHSRRCLRPMLLVLACALLLPPAGAAIIKEKAAAAAEQKKDEPKQETPKEKEVKPPPSPPVRVTCPSLPSETGRTRVVTPPPASGQNGGTGSRPTTTGNPAMVPTTTPNTNANTGNLGTLNVRPEGAPAPVGPPPASLASPAPTPPPAATQRQRTERNGGFVRREPGGGSGGPLTPITGGPGTAIPEPHRPPWNPPGGHHGGGGVIIYYPVPYPVPYSLPGDAGSEYEPDSGQEETYPNDLYAVPCSLGAAVTDIARAWQQEKIKPLLRHLKPGVRVRFYDGNQFSHALFPAGVCKMAKQVWRQIRTHSYRLAVFRVLPGEDWVVLKGTHVYDDGTTGRTGTVYVRYLLYRDLAGAWIIKEISLSDEPL